MSNFAFSAMGWIASIFYLAVFVCSVYAFILFVKVARRGIKALDIYIDENSDTE